MWLFPHVSARNGFRDRFVTGLKGKHIRVRNICGGIVKQAKKTWKRDQWGKSAVNREIFQNL